MPTLMGVVINSLDASREVKHLCVTITIERKSVVEVATMLDVPHPSLIAQHHAGERDEIHGTGFHGDVAEFG